MALSGVTSWTPEEQAASVFARPRGGICTRMVCGLVHTSTGVAPVTFGWS